MSGLAATETSSFSHVFNTIVGRESRPNSRYLSLYLRGRLPLWFGGIVVQVWLVFASFCSHAFLIQRDGERLEIDKYIGSSSNQELLYLPPESLIKRCCQHDGISEISFQDGLFEKLGVATD